MCHFFAAFFGKCQSDLLAPNLAMGILAILLNRSFYWQNGLIISRSLTRSGVFPITSALDTVTWPYRLLFYLVCLALPALATDDDEEDEDEDEDDDDDDEPLSASGNNTLFSICATVELPCCSPCLPCLPSLPAPSSLCCSLCRLPSGIAWRTCGLQLNVH